MSNSDDQTLILKIAQGDKKAFGQLLLQYQDLVFGLSMKMVKNNSVAEDIVQETWMKVIKNANQYSPVGSAKSWILQIHRNLVMDYFRETNKWKNSEDIEDCDIVDDSENIYNLIDGHEKQAAFHKFFSELDEREKLILTMVIVEELSYSEISQKLKLTVGSIKTIVFRAKNELKQKLSLAEGGL